MGFRFGRTICHHTVAMLAALMILPAQGEIIQKPTAPWRGEGPVVLETASPQAAGMDPAKLEAAAKLAESAGSDSLVVLRRGKIVLERYWNGKTADDVQQMFSATKSPFAFLVGRAIDQGFIKGLDQPVVELVPELAGAGREALTFRNIMAMESGLDQSRDLDAEDTRLERTQLEAVLARSVKFPPFERYHYNNAAYRLLFTALERATGMTLHEWTRRELFAPLGMNGAYWVELWAGERFLGYQSIRMRPRDLAKAGLIMLDKGRWAGKPYLSSEYIETLATAGSTAANPSYGLFWFLNRGDHYRDYYVPDRIDRKLLPGTPDDAICNYGSGGQLLVAVPSLEIVWVRTGRTIPSTIYQEGNTMALLSKLICESAAN